jgi:hypothetical protein
MIWDEHLPEALLPCLDAGILGIGIVRAACKPWKDQQYRRISWERLGRFNLCVCPYREVLRLQAVLNLLS